MAQKLTASLPEGMDLDQDYQIQFTAIDASTGDVIAGVNVSNASILAASLTGANVAGLELGPFMLVPGPQT